MRKIIIVGSLLFTGAAFLGSCDNNNPSTQKVEEKAAVENTAAQEEINYLEVGKEIALHTKVSLGKALAMAIGEKGSDGAVEFCNTKAIPITDSMSVLLHAKISRLSDKPRNPDNQANEAELAYIKHWKEAKAKGEEFSPLITETDEKIVGYYPIISNTMCLQCHGTAEKDINTLTLNKINKLYPTDKAVGYTADEIRGIFVIKMNKI